VKTEFRPWSQFTPFSTKYILCAPLFSFAELCWTLFQYIHSTMQCTVYTAVKSACNHYFFYNYENNQQNATMQVNLLSLSALHVSGDVFANHQEHLTIYSIW